MSDATGAAEALLGLAGLRVLEVEETATEVVVFIELVAEAVGRPECGVVARAHGRTVVDCRDLAAFGRPARLRWRRRRFPLRGASMPDHHLERVLARTLGAAC